MKPVLARGFVLVLTVVIVVPGGLLLAVHSARADSTKVMTATLPSERYSTSAVWDRTNAYVFGGSTRTYLGDVDSDEIVRYSPTTDTATTMSATLPTGREQAAAIWDGTNAYVFGGADCGGHCDKIVRYSPSLDTVTTMSAALPTGLSSMSAVWDGTNAYIFGGDANGFVDKILRYSPSADTIATMTARLPTARLFTTAVWDGTNAYIFGGTDANGRLDQILRYSPSTDTITTMSATLPTRVTSASSVWDGTNAYVFGGVGASDGPDRILRYSPSTDTITTMSATLPSGRSDTSAVWDGTQAYVFGGRGASGITHEIIRYDLAPGAPQNLTAAFGVIGNGLSWLSPPPNSYSSVIVSYSVYRSVVSGGEGATPIAVVPSFTTTYVDTTCPLLKTCYYEVTATNAAGESPRSKEAGAIDPGSDAICFDHNPNALTNGCITLDGGEQTIPVPFPSANPTLPSLSPGGGVCIIGNECAPGVNAGDPGVSIGSMDVQVPMLLVSGYIEATAACDMAPGTCRVILP